MDYAKRSAHMRQEMAARGIDVLFLPSCGDRQYLTGIATERPCTTHHHRSGDWLDGLFFTQKEAILACPWMKRAWAREEGEKNPLVTDVIILDEGRDYVAYAADILTRLGLRAPVIGVPKAAMAKSLVNLKRACPGASFVNIESITCPMRMVKDPEEIAIMREASRIADEAFLAVLPQIHAGMLELEVAQALEKEMFLRGAECVSFPTDVMALKKGAPCDGGSGLVKLEKGCNIAFDFGCVYQGYCSDTGRTIFLGEPSKKCLDIHKLVMASQQAAIDALAPGAITCVQLDGVARKVINNGGYFEEFFHRLGHNIGVDVHEYPYLNKGYTQPILENMTLTVEPSIMIPGELRIRVEDVVLVTAQGGEPLNKVTKEPIILE